MANKRRPGMSGSEALAAWMLARNTRQTREAIEAQTRMLASQQTTPRFIYYRHVPAERDVIHCELTADGAPAPFIVSSLDNGWYRWDQAKGAYTPSGPPPSPPV